MVICGSQVVRKPKATKTRIAKSRMPAKKTSRLEKAIAHLYNLEDAHESEKPLNTELERQNVINNHKPLEKLLFSAP